MKLFEISENKIPVYTVVDENGWDEIELSNDRDFRPTDGLRLFGVVLATGYRRDEDAENLYVDDNGHLYVEEILSGDNTGTAMPLNITPFELKRFLKVDHTRNLKI